VYVRPVTSEEFNFTYPLPLTVLRYTLYPDTVDVLAIQVSVTECCTTPVPDSVTVAGDPVALLVIEMLPLTLPATVGLNVTDRVRFCDGDKVTGVLPPVIKKPAPVKVICEMLTLELPVLVMVTVCAAEIVPVVMLPKLRLVGLIPRVSVAAIPDPLRLTDVGEVGALLTMEMLPEAVPTTVGENATVMVVCCPAFRLSGSVNPLTLNAEPVSFIWVMLMVAVPVFLMIKAWDVVVPTTSFPKLIGFGLT